MIDDYKAERINDAEYLRRVTDVMARVRDGKTADEPDILKDKDLSRALFGVLKEELDRGASSSIVREDEAEYGSGRENRPSIQNVLAQAACEMEKIIRPHAVVRWRENTDAQNRMRNALDDYLYDLQKAQGIELSFEQMDAIIEAVIRIAIHRTDDI